MRLKIELLFKQLVRNYIDLCCNFTASICCFQQYCMIHCHMTNTDSNSTNIMSSLKSRMQN